MNLPKNINVLQKELQISNIFIFERWEFLFPQEVVNFSNSSTTTKVKSSKEKKT